MKALKYIILTCLLLCGPQFTSAALQAAEQTFLQNFYAAMTALPALNWNISNVADACTLGWEGITCGPDLGGLRRIVGFSLRSRSLTGVLPATIKDLSTLILLYDNLSLLFRFGWFECPSLTPQN
jgi:hypothetical protein